MILKKDVVTDIVTNIDRKMTLAANILPNTQEERKYCKKYCNKQVEKKTEILQKRKIVQEGRRMFENPLKSNADDRKTLSRAGRKEKEENAKLPGPKFENIRKHCLISDFIKIIRPFL